MLAEAQLTSDRRVKVERLVAAVDCGRMVNPDLVMQQIEGGIVFAQQVVIDHGAPDEICAAQQVERRRHVAPVQIATLARVADQFQLVVVDKYLEVAREFEIDLRREKSRTCHFSRLLAAGKDRQGCGQSRTGDAIAHRMHGRHAEPLAHEVDRFDLGANIVVPGHLGHALVR